MLTWIWGGDEGAGFRIETLQTRKVVGVPNEKAWDWSLQTSEKDLGWASLSAKNRISKSKSLN
jgi:hypothetical protein